jgi:hypothetical protein
MAQIKLCKNPQGEANKSANRWVILRAKGGVVRIKYTSPTRLRWLFSLATIQCLYTNFGSKKLKLKYFSLIFIPSPHGKLQRRSIKRSQRQK